MLGEFAKYAFFGLKRKRRDFERSVLKYVSIKIPALTHSGRKSRVCVNQPDGLWAHLSEGIATTGKKMAGHEEGKDKAPCAMSSKGLWSNR